jgi:hypothetical protein
MNYQLLEYSCPECGMLLKGIVGEFSQDFIKQTSIKEECPKCGSAIVTPKRLWKQSLQTKGLYDNSKLSKFQIAYDEFISRLTFDIEALDTSLQNLNSNDNTIAIIGNSNHYKFDRKFTNILLIRLCVYSLFIHRQNVNSTSSSSSRSQLVLPYIVIVDAGNSLDFYQFVEFIRQYGLDVKETLQRIVISRAFTVYQLTNLIVNELPNIVRRLDTCLVIIPDLLHMFTNDPNVDHEEAKHLIKEIVSAIRNISTLKGLTRCVVSWNYSDQSSSYIKILLPIFDKCVEVTSFEGKHSPSSTLSLMTYNGRSSKHYKSHHFLLQPSDLYLVPQR